MHSQPPSMGLLALFRSLLSRELSVAIRSPGQWLNPILFFIIVITLFPLGVGPGPNTLSIIAPGVIWVSALLSVMLSLQSLFYDDLHNGSLEQFVLSAQPLSVVVLAKVFTWWLLSGLPLLLVSPLLAIFMNLPTSAIPVLMLSLLLGTLTLILVGAIGAALTATVGNGGGILLSLLVLPLTVPVLIFGSGAVQAAASQLPAGGYLSLLVALLALALSLAPFATAAALRVAVSAG